MKKLLLPLSVIAAAVMLSSCGGFLGVDITDQSAIDTHLRSKIEAVIGADAEVAYITLTPADHFSKKMEIATVSYFTPGDEKIKSKVIYLAGKKEPTDGMTTFVDRLTRDDAQKLSEIDFSRIATNIAAAVELMKEEDYEFSGVSEYEMELDSDPSEIVHEFSIESKEGSRMTTGGGRLATETSYYEFTFRADARGNIELVD